DICIAILNKKLSTLNINWKNRFSVSVVLTSNGYPGKFESGFEICGLENINNNNTIVFHSGTKFKLGKFFTCSGRVLSVTSTADNIKSAINNVYFDINNLYFENMYYRRDIARMELEH
ncbi:MAG: hypothetical protein LBH27_01375, partial [Endomicrobium sp.]|nr:hypothetical protein [Endomicrobium sp.]